MVSTIIPFFINLTYLDSEILKNQFFINFWQQIMTITLKIIVEESIDRELFENLFSLILFCVDFYYEILFENFSL